MVMVGWLWLWLGLMGWQYCEKLPGMYVNGHKRIDVVDYHTHDSLPQWNNLAQHMVKYDKNGDVAEMSTLQPGEKPIILLTHDKSTFYANDEQKI